MLNVKCLGIMLMDNRTGGMRQKLKSIKCGLNDPKLLTQRPKGKIGESLS